MSRRQDQIVPRKPAYVELGLTDEDGFPLRVRSTSSTTTSIPTLARCEFAACFRTSSFSSSGLFVRVRVPSAIRAPATLVSEQALGTDQGHKFVYVVDREQHRVARAARQDCVLGGLRVIGTA